MKECASRKRTSLPPSHRVFAARNQRTSIQRDNIVPIESGIYEWLVASPHTCSSTHNTERALTDLSTQQQHSNIFVLSLSVVCRFRFIYRWRWRFKLMRSHIEFAAYDHMRKPYAHTVARVYSFVYTCNPPVIHTLTHTHTQQARRVHNSVCAKRADVRVYKFLFRSYCFISFIIVVHIKCRWRWWLCGDVIRWIKHTQRVQFQKKVLCISFLRGFACVFVSRQTKRQHRPLKTKINK